MRTSHRGEQQPIIASSFSSPAFPPSPMEGIFYLQALSVWRAILESKNQVLFWTARPLVGLELWIPRVWGNGSGVKDNVDKKKPLRSWPVLTSKLAWEELSSHGKMGCQSLIVSGPVLSRVRCDRK